MARTGEGQGEWSLKLTPEEERAHRRRVDAATMTDVKPATKEQRLTIETPEGNAIFVKSDGQWFRVAHDPYDTCTCESVEEIVQALIARIEQEQAISASMARLTMADTKYMEGLETTIERLKTAWATSLEDALNLEDQLKMEQVKVDLLKKLRDEQRATIKRLDKWCDKWALKAQERQTTIEACRRNARNATELLNEQQVTIEQEQRIVEIWKEAAEGGENCIVELQARIRKLEFALKANKTSLDLVDAQLQDEKKQSTELKEKIDRLRGRGRAVRGGPEHDLWNS